MPTSFKQPQRIVWSEGMLMSPQHLQQQDHFHEAMLNCRLTAVDEFAWGIYEQTFDDAAIKRGEIRLISFTGIFPDGGFLAFGANDMHCPASRSFLEQFPATRSALEVYLAAPIEREGVPNFEGPSSSNPENSNSSSDTVSPRNKSSRFRTFSRTVPDLTAAKSELSVQFAHPHTFILVGNETRENHHSIKIGELTRDSNGAFIFSPNYIPPSLSILTSERLMNELRELLAVCISKQRNLADSRRQRDAASIEFSNKDFTRYLLLNAVNTNIPLIKHIVETPQTSPLAAYLMLIQFAGQLSSFSAVVDPSSFPSFQFQNLSSTFFQLLAKIHEMLGASVRENFLRVPLEARKDGMWLGKLADEKLGKCTAFVVAIESDHTEQEVAQKLPGLSKIASWRAISGIVQVATPGAPLKVTHRPPEEIPIRPRTVYFHVTMNDKFWRDIMKEKTVAIYLPPPFDFTRINLSLLAVLPRESN